MSGYPLPETTRQRIYRLADQGLLQKVIAERLGLHVVTVRKQLQKRRLDKYRANVPTLSASGSGKGEAA